MDDVDKTMKPILCIEQCSNNIIIQTLNRSIIKFIWIVLKIICPLDLELSLKQLTGFSIFESLFEKMDTHW